MIFLLLRQVFYNEIYSLLIVLCMLVAARNL